MADRPDGLEEDAQWRTAGDRIQTLLDASAAVVLSHANALNSCCVRSRTFTALAWSG
jgi:hypothetical protein